MIRSSLRAQARACARHLSDIHEAEDAGIAEARCWYREADRLRDNAELAVLSPHQRAALCRCAAEADHRAIWCLEMVG